MTASKDLMPIRKCKVCQRLYKVMLDPAWNVFGKGQVQPSYAVCSMTCKENMINKFKPRS